VGVTGEPWRIGVILETWANRVTLAKQSVTWRQQVSHEIDQRQASIRGWLAMQQVPWTRGTRRAMVCGILYALNDMKAQPAELAAIADLVNVCSGLLLDINECGEDLA
jgi:hypothetical protein